MVFPTKGTLKQIQVTSHLNPSLKNKKKRKLSIMQKVFARNNLIYWYSNKLKKYLTQNKIIFNIKQSKKIKNASIQLIVN